MCAVLVVLHSYQMPQQETKEMEKFSGINHIKPQKGIQYIEVQLERMGTFPGKGTLERIGI